MNARDQLVPDTATQEELNAKLALSKKPKIEKEDLDKAIVSTDYHVFPGSCLTVCVLTLFNGFTVTGESACADPGNFKEDIGRALAYRNAKDKIWSLLGFQLKTRLDMIQKAGPPTGRMANVLEVATYVGTKVVRAAPMSRQSYNDLRGWIVPVGENPEDEGYLVEYVDGGQPNVPEFTGYISWSPKNVFERAYSFSAVPEPKKQLSRVERMQAEWSELDGNVQRLTAFLGTDFFKSLPREEQSDLTEQHMHMKDYRWFLGKRLDRIAKAATTN